MEGWKEQSIGEEFIKNWYRLMDGKAPIEALLSLTAGEALQVDFPGNPLDLAGFAAWYQGQCQKFTGQHILHSVKTERKNGELVIFGEVTWRAMDSDGKEIALFPNVTLRLREEDGLKVYYYGCRDREEPSNSATGCKGL